MKKLFLCLALIGMIAVGCGESNEIIDKTEQPGDNEKPDDDEKKR